MLASHVNNCTVTSNSATLILSFKREVGSHYKITDLKPISWLLRMKLTCDQEAQTISLSQQTYTEAILMKYNLANCKQAAIPLDPGLRLSHNQSPKSIEEAAHMKNVPYHATIRSPMHLAVRTRPDIAFTISTIAQFNNAPGLAHWEAVKHIYRYLAGTKSLALTFEGVESGLEGYIDADGATQEHHHAISGYAYLLDGGAISWASCKQELVMLSTAEAEYVATTHAAKEGLWLRQLIGEVFHPLKHLIPLYSDSQAAIALMKDRRNHAQTKHIDSWYHFIHCAVENHSFHLIYCPTTDMVADTLTRALPSIKAKHFALALGLHPK